MLRSAVIVIALFCCVSCSNKEHDVDITEPEAPCVQPSHADVPYTAPVPLKQPQFKLGTEVRKPRGCMEGETRGVDC